MPTELAMESIIFASKFAVGCLPKFRRLEKRLSFFTGASEPTLSVFVLSLECPSQVFDLDHLTQQRGRGVLSAISEQIGNRRRKLAADSKQQRNRDNLVAAMAAGRVAVFSVGPKSVPNGMKFVANLTKRASSELRECNSQFG